MSRPRCLSQVRRRIPVPAGAAQHTTPTMIIFGQPTRQPTTCLSRAMAQRLRRSCLAHIYDYLALNHHRHQLDCVCPACTSKQCKTISPGGPSYSQPRPAEMNRSSTSKQSSEQPAGQPVAQPRPHPALTTSRASHSHFRNVFRAELCTTNQPRLSQSVLEPRLLEGSNSNARGLIRSRT